jgi:hypothetical protein
MGVESGNEKGKIERTQVRSELRLLLLISK